MACSLFPLWIHGFPSGSAVSDTRTTSQQTARKKIRFMLVAERSITDATRTPATLAAKIRCPPIERLAAVRVERLVCA